MRRCEGERGVTLVIVALCMVVMLIFAGFSVDLGAVYIERRQDQSAADAASMGAALQAPQGRAAIGAAAQEIVRQNLTTTYTDAEWYAAWASCADADRLAQRGLVNGTETNCISYDPVGMVRVKVPQQFVKSSFGKVIGIDGFNSTAKAVASLKPTGGGILPLLVVSGAAPGDEICLKSGSGGTSADPCNGPDSGNFGTLNSPIYGAELYGTQGIACGSGAVNDRLTVNLAVGIDHLIVPYTVAAGVIADACGVFGPPNSMETLTGNRDLLAALFTNASLGGVTFPGRLRTNFDPSRDFVQNGTTYKIDNRPLWDFIGENKSDVPASCKRETFFGIPAGPARTAQLEICFDDYGDGSGYGPLFDYKVADEYLIDLSSRFGWVPEMYCPGGAGTCDMPSGTKLVQVLQFRPVFIQAAHLNCNGTDCYEFNPGEETGPICPGCGVNNIREITAFVLPVASLPPEFTNNGAGGILGPYRVSLYE
ncbi:MAG: pilus assembly protein TadG-related protein [Actinomycetota bacterium]